AFRRGEMRIIQHLRQNEIVVLADDVRNVEIAGGKFQPYKRARPMRLNPADAACALKKPGVTHAELERHLLANPLVPALCAGALKGNSGHAEIFQRRPLVLDDDCRYGFPEKLLGTETLRPVEHSPPLGTCQLLVSSDHLPTPLTHSRTVRLQCTK